MAEELASGEHSLDPAYFAEEPQLPDSYDGFYEPRSDSPTLSLPPPSSLPPSALGKEEIKETPASEGSPVLSMLSTSGLVSSEDLEKLEEIVRSDESVANHLKQEAYQKILNVAKTIPGSPTNAAAQRRVQAVKPSFELYYLFNRTIDLDLLIELLEDEDVQIRTQVYQVLHHIIYFCPLTPTSKTLRHIKRLLIPLLHLTLSTSLTSTFPLPLAILSFTINLLKKAPYLLIPDLFVPSNAKEHGTLLWLSDKYGEITSPAARWGGKVRREIDMAWRDYTRKIFEREGVRVGRESEVRLASAEKIVGWWAGWLGEGQ
ncbi:hypothetical protein GP486_001095, partial [Trichoglossum hirsutum]